MLFLYAEKGNLENALPLKISTRHWLDIQLVKG